LIHDDVQDESLARRGGATLHSEHGIGIAVNVGNATNLLALLRLMENRQLRFGWYVGGAFQIQDDILNLTGDFAMYGKEIGGDLWEGKRTLMLIQL
jgi:geranylgeranyl pyrophosphate synthase